jgi:Raf kinase inhibitor-like YbhB/YbcL family protein
MPAPARSLPARIRLFVSLFLLAWGVGLPTGAEGATPSDHHVDVAVKGHIFLPAELPAPELSAVKVPAGFKIARFADNLGNVRMLAVAPDGTIYATRRDEGDVLMLKDGGHGRAAGPPVRVASRSGLHGIALHQGKVYLATPHQIFRGAVLPDGHFGPLEMIVHDLPDAGQHNTRTVQIGPDGMMYISVGSTCNECLDPNSENATILRATPDGKSRAIFASGLRDTIAWGWQPQTGELWGMDQGMDWLGDDLPPEELNHIEKGHHYGWPHIWGDNQINQHLHIVGGIEPSEWQATSTPMVMGYRAHAAPMQLAFYDGAQFPAAYRGDAFVSMHGSWNRKPPAGYEVVRIRFKDGKPIGFEPFVTGFVTSKGQSGRLCGAAVAHDGALLFTDDRNGIIYRVSYVGASAEKAAPASAATAAAIPDGPMREQAAKGSGVPIAIQRPETETSGRLTVSSPAFASGGVVPALFSEYEQGANFPLSWTPGPAGTRSYVLIMEDPDSKPPSPVPVVHWLAWNIPGDITALREGLQKQDRLVDPAGLRQGPSSSGSVGYKGPRPPAGDPPHHYHVQIFALDRELPLKAGANRDEVLAAMKGHVRARGELIGTMKRPDAPARP